MQKSKTTQNKHHDVHLKTSARPVCTGMCAWEGLLLQKRGKKSRSQEVKEVKSYATPKDNCLEEH